MIFTMIKIVLIFLIFPENRNLFFFRRDSLNFCYEFLIGKFFNSGRKMFLDKTFGDPRMKVQKVRIVQGFLLSIRICVDIRTDNILRNHKFDFMHRGFI